jgi:hypothetical protein
MEYSGTNTVSIALSTEVLCVASLAVELIIMIKSGLRLQAKSAIRIGATVAPFVIDTSSIFHPFCVVRCLAAPFTSVVCRISSRTTHYGINLTLIESWHRFGSRATIRGRVFGGFIALLLPPR